MFRQKASPSAFDKDSKGNKIKKRLTDHMCHRRKIIHKYTLKKDQLVPMKGRHVMNLVALNKFKSTPRKTIIMYFSNNWVQ